MENSQSERTSDWTSIDPKANGGLFLLALAWIFFSLNFLTELNAFVRLINDPVFVPGTMRMDSATSIGTGWAQVFHIIFFLPVGVVMLFAALIRRNFAKPGRTRKIVILTAIGILLFPGTLSVAAASLVGPSPIAQQGIQNAKDSATAMEKLRTEGGVPEFSMIDEYWPGEPDTSWRTGVYNLEQPKIEETCKLAISYALENGATLARELPAGESIDLVDKTKAIDYCVKTMNGYPHKKRHKFEVVSQPFALSGASNTDPSVPLIFRLTLIKYGYQWEKPNSWGYEFFIATTFDENH